MRYKETIAQLERDLADAHKNYSQAENDFVATNRKLTEERDSYATALETNFQAAKKHIQTLTAERDAARTELQQTIDAIPQLIAQQLDAHFEQRLNELLANPQLLRERIMQHAQQAQNPANLFAALQAMQMM